MDHTAIKEGVGEISLFISARKNYLFISSHELDIYFYT